MKKYFFTWLLAFVSTMSMAQDLTVGSYNIRNKNSSDSIHGEIWSLRCKAMCDMLNWERPAIFGTQEVLHGQLLDMHRQLDGYEFLGVGRDDGKEDGEYAAIFYRKERLQLKDSGNFWLNETPDRPALGWDAACVRICSWGLFNDKVTRKPLLFLNLHMDHVGTVARREAAKLVVKRIEEMKAKLKKDCLVILTGDFNVDETDEIYTIFTHSGILKDCYEATRLRFFQNGTFNSFDPSHFTTHRIDHIFVSPSANVDSYAVRTDSYWTKNADGKTYQRRNPSDHYPVFARLKL